MSSNLPHAAGTCCETRERSKEKGGLAQQIQKLIKRCFFFFPKSTKQVIWRKNKPKKSFLAVSLITWTAKHRWFLSAKQTLFKAPSIQRTQNNNRNLADGRMIHPKSRGEEVLGVPVPRFPVGQTHKPPRHHRWL